MKNQKSFEKTYVRGQKYLIMDKLAETLIKSTEQLFFIPPVTCWPFLLQSGTNKLIILLERIAGNGQV